MHAPKLIITYKMNETSYKEPSKTYIKRPKTNDCFLALPIIENKKN